MLPSEIIRPIILAASVFVVILRSPFTDVVGERWPGLRPLGFAIDIALLSAAWWVFWRYYPGLFTERRERGGERGLNCWDSV